MKCLNSIAVDKLSEPCRIAAENWIEQIVALNAREYGIGRQLMAIAERDCDARNLESIPGIGTFGALLIKSEIGDIGRFATFNRLCAYAGLAPRTFQSADKEYHGPLNKNRRKHLQWILIEGSHHFAKSSPERTAKYEAIANRKAPNVARVVLARDLLKIVYRVLKDKRPYYARTVAPLALNGV